MAPVSIPRTQYVMTDPIRLSKRQIGDADRIGGIELMIPWPPELPPPQLGEDMERDTTAAEHALAEQLVLPACRTADLVPVHSRAMYVRPAIVADWRKGDSRPGYRPYLAVVIIGRRWVHATGAPDPLVRWVL